jgi:ribosomal protein S18 acetylase RimI-like enzyme
MVMLEKARAGHAALGRLEAGDGEALRRFFFRLSAESVYKRFLSPIARPEQLEGLHLLDLDGVRRQALVAILDGEIVGVARFARAADDDPEADLGIAVADDWQRQGLGTRLLAALAEAARAAGIERFSFMALPENQAAVRLVRRIAPDTRLAFAGGVLEGFVPLRAA